MSLIVLLLAAGRSARMRGRDKLMEPVNGHPCLREMVMRVLDAKLRLIVTVPDLLHPRNAALDGLNLIRVPVPDADQGMAHSIAAGVAALPTGTQAVMVVPADIPTLETADFALMADAYQTNLDLILRATNEAGKPGHPVIFPSGVFESLTHLTGDRGAQEVIRANPDRLRYITLPSEHATTDLDTPEDWENWHLKT
jgi:molybdenum cofactor cytidylyltransferase